MLRVRTEAWSWRYVAWVASLYLLALAAAGAAYADPWAVEPYVRSSVTWTSNANFERGDVARSDTVFELAPGIRVSGRGERWSVTGGLLAQGVAYARSTQSNRVLPEGDLRLRGVGVEDWFFVEAGASAVQETSNVFGGRATGPSFYNKFTVVQYRLSPYVEHEFNGGTRVYLRSDNGWTETVNGPPQAADGYYGLQTAIFEKRPRPIGGSLEYTRNQTRFRGQQQNAFFEEIGRAVLSYAVDPELIVGIVGGYDRYELPFFHKTRSLYGLRLKWEPTDRTSFDGTVEKRFFGTGWSAHMNHRLSSQVAFSARFARDVSTYAQSLFSLPATGNVAGLIDSLLGSAIRDPIQRDKVVRDFLVQRDLPSTLPSSITIYDERATLSNSANGTVTLIGARDTLAFTLFYTRNEALEVPGTPSFQLNPLVSNNRQSGAAVNFGRRMTPLTLLSGTVSWFDTRGIGENRADKTRQGVLVGEVIRQFTPRTSGLLGLRYQRIQSNVRTDADEKAGYVGLLIRF